MIEPEDARRFLSACRAGLRGIRAAPMVFALSVSTMAAGLLLLGTFLLVVQNMRGVLARFGEEFTVVAFLTPEASAEGTQRDELEKRLAALGGISAVRFVSPDQALERLRLDLGREAAVLDALETNPLPGSFELELGTGRRTPEHVRMLARQISRTAGVAEVRYGADWVEGYARLLQALEWVGLALGGFLIFVLGTTVAGTVRLAVHARFDEIQIQRLVGAGALFVRLPFYLEGTLQGGVAALLALLTLYGLFALGLPLVGDLLAFLLGPTVPQFFSLADMLLLVLMGVALGLGAAMLSLLRVDETA